MRKKQRNNAKRYMIRGQSSIRRNYDMTIVDSTIRYSGTNKNPISLIFGVTGRSAPFYLDCDAFRVPIMNEHFYRC